MITIYCDFFILTFYSLYDKLILASALSRLFPRLVRSYLRTARGTYGQACFFFGARCRGTARTESRRYVNTRQLHECHIYICIDDVEDTDDNGICDDVKPGILHNKLWGKGGYCWCSDTRQVAFLSFADWGNPLRRANNDKEVKT
jgi:hypothetical protein